MLSTFWLAQKRGIFISLNCLSEQWVSLAFGVSNDLHFIKSDLVVGFDSEHGCQIGHVAIAYRRFVMHNTGFEGFTNFSNMFRNWFITPVLLSFGDANFAFTRVALRVAVVWCLGNWVLYLSLVSSVSFPIECLIKKKGYPQFLNMLNSRFRVVLPVMLNGIEQWKL